MSTFNKETKHPKTGKWENATWYDDFFGNHHYGVQFPSDQSKDVPWRDQITYDPDTVNLETRDTTANFKVRNEEAEKALASIGKILKELCPAGMGFAFLLFDYGEEGDMFYCSSAQRDDMIKAMKEFIEKN